MHWRQLVLLLVGMALFVGAAILAMALLPGRMHIPRTAKVIFPLAVLGLSAAIPFAAVYLRDWRVRRGPLLWRGVSLGLSVVLGAHAIFGFVAVMAMLVLTGGGSALEPLRDLGVTLLSAPILSTFSFLGAYATFPCGAVTGVVFVLLEWWVNSSDRPEERSAV